MVRRPADLRFGFNNVELAAVGDFLVIAGDPADLDPLRDGVGPVVVSDLEDTIQQLTAQGAVVEQPPATSETGVFAYVRHPDGSLFEYVQWKPAIAARVLDAGAAGV